MRYSGPRSYAHVVAERIFITGKSVCLRQMSGHGIPTLAATTTTSAALSAAAGQEVGEITLGPARAGTMLHLEALAEALGAAGGVGQAGYHSQLWILSQFERF